MNKDTFQCIAPLRLYCTWSCFTSNSRLVIIVIVALLIYSKSRLERLQDEGFKMNFSSLDNPGNPGQEIIDISRDGRPNNNSISIHLAHTKFIPHRGVWIFVVNQERQLLLIKRSNASITCPNTWMPPGEHCHTNEPYLDTVYRGLREELSLFHNDIKYIRPISQEPVLFTIKYSIGRRDIQWTQSYLVALRDGVSIKATNYEAISILWLPLDSVSNWLLQCPEQVCRSCEVNLFTVSTSLLGSSNLRASTYYVLNTTFRDAIVNNTMKIMTLI